jgi:Fe-S oxidoreductase
LVNAILSFWPVRAAMELIFGIDRRRRLPRYASRRLTRWWAAHGGTKIEGGSNSKSNLESNLELRNSGKENLPGVSAKDGNFHEFLSSRFNQDSSSSLMQDGNGQPRRVALFCDTYIEHFQSEVGRAAVEVLESAGFRVDLAVAGCCQRPAISKGVLAVAKREGTRTMERLDAWARQGVPILVCEPSCASALADDLPDLIDDAKLGARVAACVRPIDQFLGEELAAGRIKLSWGPPRPRTLLVHGHCHHKAIFDMKPALALLRAIPGATVTAIDAGCCGMAGAFGYEKEHYDLSVKVAEDRFLPALRNAPAGARLVAAGFSCRHQAADLASGLAVRPAIHPIVAVREALANSHGRDF